MYNKLFSNIDDVKQKGRHCYIKEGNAQVTYESYEDSLYIFITLPGISKENVSASCMQLDTGLYKDYTQVTIDVVTKNKEKDGPPCYCNRDVTKSIKLLLNFNIEELKATMVDGVLTIVAKEKEEQKEVKKIEVL